MASKSQTCGPITGPITDTATHTYSNGEGFTPPASCLDSTYTSQPTGSDTFYTWLDTISTAGSNTTSTRWLHAFRGREPACFPSHYPVACEWMGTVQQQQHYIYSPASCPGGYAGAKTGIDAESTAITTATCCPSGFALSTPAIGGDTFQGDPVTCTSVGSQIVISGETRTFEANVLTLYAPTVMVAWQTSDLARWGLPIPTATSTGAVSPSDDASASSSGLSTGAKAGIGVGCAVVAVIALAGLLLFFRRRSQRKRRDAIETIDIAPKDSPHLSHSTQPLPVKEKGQKGRPVRTTELGDEAALQEISSDGRRLEADDKSARAELP